MSSETTVSFTEEQYYKRLAKSVAMQGLYGLELDIVVSGALFHVHPGATVDIKGLGRRFSSDRNLRLFWFVKSVEIRVSDNEEETSLTLIAPNIADTSFRGGEVLSDSQEASVATVLPFDDTTGNVPDVAPSDVNAANFIASAQVVSLQGIRDMGSKRYGSHKELVEEMYRILGMEE